MKRGLARLQHDISEITTISNAYNAVLQAGIEHAIAQLESWPYHIAPLYGANVKMNFHSVSPTVGTPCRDLAGSLGLEHSTLTALAMMSMLVEFEFTGDLPEVLTSQLEQFHRAVRERAHLAASLAQQAASAMPRPAHRGSWTRIIKGEA